MSEDQKPSALKVIGSVLAAFIGVQSNKNRERDFKHGRVAHFIIAGLILTLVFIVLVYGAVKFALSGVGG